MPKKYVRPPLPLACCYCETPLTEQTITREHIRPKSKGGRGKNINGKNVRGACFSCNNEKGNMYLNEYIGYLMGQEYTPLIETKIKNAKKLLKG